MVSRPTGEHFPGDGPELAHCVGGVLSWNEMLVQAFDLGKNLVVTASAERLRLADEIVVQVMRFEMHHIVRQHVFGITIVRAPATEEDDGKAVFREGPDDLVDPA